MIARGRLSVGDRVTSDEFAAGAWMEGLAVELRGLCEAQSRTVRCEGAMAYINSEYKLRGVRDLEPGDGIPVQQFAGWYTDLHGQNETAMDSHKRKDPSLVRGLRVAIVQTPTKLESVRRQLE